jgi:hypothetical protein
MRSPLAGDLFFEAGVASNGVCSCLGERPVEAVLEVIAGR